MPYSAASAASISIIKNLNSKSYLTGATQLANAASDPDRFLPSATRQTIGSFAPNVLKFAGQQSDPVIRDDRAFDEQTAQTRELERLKNFLFAKSIPGWAEDNLPPRRDIFGVQLRSSFAGFRTGEDLTANDPLRAALGDLNFSPSLNAQVRSIEGIGLSPAQRTRVGELMTDTKRGGKTMSEAMRALVTSPRWEELTPNQDGIVGARQKALQKITDRYVRAARRQFTREDSPEAAELRAAILEKRRRAAAEAEGTEPAEDNAELQQLLQVLQ